MAADNKEKPDENRDIFLTFLFNYTLLHPLELPHRGNSNGIPQCVV